MCGVIRQLGAASSGLSGRIGSTETTSTAAPASDRRSSASARSASTTSGPRAVLIKNARRLDLSQPVAIDQAGRLRRQRTMQADHVGAGEQVVELAPLRRLAPATAACETNREPGSSSRTRGPARRALADPAEPDDPHRLAGQLDERRLADREVGLIRPLTGPDGLVVQADVVAKLQDQREHVLGDGVRAIDRHVRDRDALARAPPRCRRSRTRSPSP